MKLSAIYLRKSRADIEAEQKGEGETLARHEAALLTLAKSNNIIIGKMYKEIVSGDSIVDRPVIQQLLKDVENETWNSVLVMDIDRLARGNTVDQGIIAETFKYSNTKIMTPNKVYDPNNEFDEEYFEYGLFMARREYTMIKRRLQRGRETSVKEGKYVGSRPPFGYERIKIPNDKGYTLKINENEANVVRLIFELYTKGLANKTGERERIGVSKITRYLNNMGFKPQKNGQWSPTSIRDILINPVYIGMIRWNWRPTKKKLQDGDLKHERPRNDPTSENMILVKGLHPPIIEKETFDTAQKFMKQNPPRPVHITKTIKNPLAGLVICGKCGRHMERRPYGNGHIDTILCPYTTCDNVSSNLDIVEHKVLSALEDWLTDYKLRWKQQQAASPYAVQLNAKKKTLRQLNKSLDTAKKQLENVYDLLEQGIYTTEIFLQRSNKLNETIGDIEKQKKAIENSVKSEENSMDNYKILIPKIEHILDVYWNVSNPKTKNDMLKEVIDHIDYIKTKRGTRKNPNDDFRLTIYPKLPK